MSKFTLFFTPIILLLAYITYNLINFLEIFKKLSPIGNENCRVVRGAVGIEDLVKFGKNGKYLIGSSDDRGKLWELPEFKNKNTPDGKMVLIDTEVSSLNDIKIQNFPIKNFPHDIAFHPHGIYLYKQKYLYVINHAYHKGGERVEVFKVIEENETPVYLNYLRSIIFSNEFVGIMNDLAVIGDDDKFVITKYLPLPDSVENGRSTSIFNSLFSTLTIGTNIKLTNAFYCHKNNCSIILPTASLMNNGITFDGKDTLYVVHVMERRVRVLKVKERDSEFDFTFEKDIDTGYAFDNIEYDFETGKISAGLIGKMVEHMRIVLYYHEHKTLKGIDSAWYGSLEIDTKNNNEIKLLTLQNDKFFGISSAIRKGDMVFHSSWIDDGVLVCKIK